eukprot:6201269-Pleurochrysis_carterae.AAC.3
MQALRRADKAERRGMEWGSGGEGGAEVGSEVEKGESARAGERVEGLRTSGMGQRETARHGQRAFRIKQREVVWASPNPLVWCSHWASLEQVILPSPALCRASLRLLPFRVESRRTTRRRGPRSTTRP